MEIRAGEPRCWPAPAKINLFLHVTGRRADGYHQLQTLFQILDWGDDVRIVSTDSPEIRRPRATYPVAEQDDLVVKAAQLLKAETMVPGGACIEVIKRIPSGAGLGGGSSDAATVLLVLNQLWGCGLTTSELALLGKRLGADLPVFIRGYSALATGIGDELSPLDLGKCHYLLIFPGYHVSTQKVFADPELPRNSATLELPEIRAGEGRNDCEQVVTRMFPALQNLITELQVFGEVRMTGTGSALFIRMPDKKSAKRAAQKIKCRYNVRAVSGVDRSPLHNMLESED